MTITLSNDTATRLEEKARAEGLSVDAYVEQLIREDGEWGEFIAPPLAENDVEFAEIKSAVSEGLEQAKRGESAPAEEVFARHRAKCGTSP